MYSADSWIRGLICCSVSAKNKVFQLSVKVHESMSPQVRESAIPQSAEYIRPTDSVQRPAIHSVPSSSGRSGSTLSGGAAPQHIINFVHASPPQPSTAVHAYVSDTKPTVCMHKQKQMQPSSDKHELMVQRS